MIRETISFIQEVTWFPASVRLHKLRVNQLLFASRDINQLKSLRECKYKCTLMRPSMVWMIFTLDLLSQIQLKNYCPFIVIFSWQEKVWRISALCQVSWMIHEKIFIQVVRVIQTFFASTDINQLKSLRDCKNNCTLMRPPMVDWFGLLISYLEYSWHIFHSLIKFAAATCSI